MKTLFKEKFIFLVFFLLLKFNIYGGKSHKIKNKGKQPVQELVRNNRIEPVKLIDIEPVKLIDKETQYNLQDLSFEILTVIPDSARHNYRLTFKKAEDVVFSLIYFTREDCWMASRSYLEMNDRSSGEHCLLNFGKFFIIQDNFALKSQASYIKTLIPFGVIFLALKFLIFECKDIVEEEFWESALILTLLSAFTVYSLIRLNRSNQNRSDLKFIMQRFVENSCSSFEICIPPLEKDPIFYTEFFGESSSNVFGNRTEQERCLVKKRVEDLFKALSSKINFDKNYRNRFVA